MIGKRIHPESPISDDQTYCVVGTPKDGDGDRRVALVGTFDECLDYADRNDSPDNYERYAVHEHGN
jgi:hypothetical protein